MTHITPEWHLEKPERLQYILRGIDGRAAAIYSRAIYRRRYLFFSELTASAELLQVVTARQMVVKLNDLPNLASDQLPQIHSEAYLAKMKSRVARSLSLIPQHATQSSQEQQRDSQAQDT